MQLGVSGSQTAINSHSNGAGHTQKDRSNDRVMETGERVCLGVKYKGQWEAIFYIPLLETPCPPMRPYIPG